MAAVLASLAASMAAFRSDWASSTFWAFSIATMESPSESSVPSKAEYFFAIARAEPAASSSPAIGCNSPTLARKAVSLLSASASSSEAWKVVEFIAVTVPPVEVTVPSAATMTVQSSPSASHMNVTEPLVSDSPASISSGSSPVASGAS